MSTTENAASAPTASSYPGLFSQAISAGLARRLAEAATGYADEGVVYVMARYTPIPDSEDPYDVQALQNLDQPVPDGYGLFGPFESTLTPPTGSQATVDAFQITLSDSTTTATFPMDILAQKYDALFYSAAAVKKFAVPYYSSLYSGAYGDHVLESFQAAPVALMAHMPWSEYTMVEFTAGEKPGNVDSPVPVDPINVDSPVHVAPVHVAPVNGDPVNVDPVNVDPVNVDLPVPVDSVGEIAVLFVMDDKGNLRPRPLHPLAGHLRGGATPQGSQTPRNAGSRAT